MVQKSVHHSAGGGVSYQLAAVLRSPFGSQNDGLFLIAADERLQKVPRRGGRQAANPVQGDPVYIVRQPSSHSSP